MLADFDQLAASVFAPPARGDLSHRLGDADKLGARFAGRNVHGIRAISDPDWLFEVKYDGYQMVAKWDGDHV